MIAITASTWWRATKEASCIVCQQCRDTVVIISTTVNTCTHTHTRSTAPPRLVLRHHLPSAFTVTMVQWICTVGQETDFRRHTGGEGGIAIISSTLLTICKSQSKKKKCIKMLLTKKKKEKRKSSPIRFARTSWDMKPVAKHNAVQLWYTENRANGCGNALKKPIVVYK